jgi:hypothetical protein
MTSEDYFSKNHPFPFITGSAADPFDAKATPVSADILETIKNNNQLTIRDVEIDKLHEQVLKLKRENIILSETLDESLTTRRRSALDKLAFCVGSSVVTALVIAWLR